MVFYETDISSTVAIEKVAQDIRREHGDPTVLINNAGTGNSMLIVEQSTEETERVIKINVICHFHLVQQFLPVMIKQDHGHIVTVASMASFVTQGKNVSYACPKAAVLAFHEGLA